MSNNVNTKKRRVEGGARVSIDGAGSSGGDSSAAAELIAIKSTIDELVHQNHTQNENVASMLQLMKSMQGEVKDMRGEIKQLRQKCDDTNSKVNSGLDDVLDKIDVVDNKQVRRKFEMVHMIKGIQGEMKNTRGEIAELQEKCDDMHTKQNTSTMKLRKIKGRLDVVDNNQKYQELILKNQTWEYSAPRPSEDYWDSLDEEEDENAENFLEQVEKYTKEMRHGNAHGDIIIGDRTLNDIVHYNEELLPHWKEFASALEQYRQYLKYTPNESDFFLSNIELSEEVIDLLSKALESTNFSGFGLACNNMGQKGIEFALNYLENNSKCYNFGIIENRIDMENLRRLCRIIKNHPYLKGLSLGVVGDEDDNGYDVLKMVLTAGKSKLTTIHLSNNGIKTEGDTFISDFISQNSCLTYLGLADNQLDDNDAVTIASAMKYNTQLETLCLVDNNFTDAGWGVLSKAIFDNTSLNSAADSNHTCSIDFPSDNAAFAEVLEINGTKWLNPLFVRQKKIYSILSTRNKDCSNVQYLDKDMPVELLPNMLHSIQKYSNYRDRDADIRQVRDHVPPLSLVYEFCRHWEKSLAVFEELSS